MFLSLNEDPIAECQKNDRYCMKMEGNSLTLSNAQAERNMNYVYMYLFMYNNILCDHPTVNALSAIIGFISFTLHAMCNIKGPEG